MRRALDELADMLHHANGRPRTRRVNNSVELSGQFGLPITPSRWAQLERLMPCPLPPLERRPDGLWSFPRGWTTVWDLAAHVARCCPDWQPPHGAAAADWQEAQVFAGVRACLVESLNVAPEEVVRPARLMADLGAQ